MRTRTIGSTVHVGDGVRRQHRTDGPTRELCIMACVFCRDPLFKEWIRRQQPIGTSIDENGAKAFITTICEIESRNELDTNAEAAERFHGLVRVPFLMWKEQL